MSDRLSGRRNLLAIPLDDYLEIVLSLSPKSRFFPRFVPLKKLIKESKIYLAGEKCEQHFRCC